MICLFISNLNPFQSIKPMNSLLLLATIATLTLPTLFSQPATAQSKSTVLTHGTMVADAKPTVEQLIDRANSKVTAEDYRGAVEDYTLAIKMKPENLVDIHMMRGTAYMLMNDEKFAFTDFDQAIELAPNDAKTYMVRAFFYGSNSPEKAIADYNKAIQLSPKDAESYSRIAYIRVSQTKHSEAIKAFSQYLKLANSENISQKDYADRGISYHAIGDYKNALADFNKSIELEPLYASGYYRRALTYQAMGQKQQALTNLKKALEIYTGMPEFKDDPEVTEIKQKIKELE